MKLKKTVYYDDLLNDEFSGNQIKRVPLGNYSYVSKNIFFRLFAFFTYWAIAYPILYIFLKLVYHVRVKGKKNRKYLRKQGLFIYGNHTQMADGVTGQVFAMRAKRGYIVSNQDATSIKGIRWLIKALGCIPVPETQQEAEQFTNCIKLRVKQHKGIVIFPEAHIWPYSTHIRPFKDDAFIYPAELGAPIIVMATTYRQRKFFKNSRPYMTLHLSKPIYPDMKLPLQARKRQLRDYAYNFMVEKASEEENAEYIRYEKRPIREINKD